MKLALIHPQIIRSTSVETFLIEFAKRLTTAWHELTYITSHITPEIGAMLPGRWELLPRLRGSATMRLWHSPPLRQPAPALAAFQCEAPV